ncbi:MAG: helix-turn-helix domain-containing GNAT family N-acetyltransferase [Acidobacteriota bacterium]|nr:helix-turn-helix domain-containing GNAT family N-acetyltransferase [Acidobacteriota bacterium]
MAIGLFMKLDFEKRISAVRKFNRGFAKRIGLLQEGLLNSPYTLTEARILFEIGSHIDYTASDLSTELGFDPGHLSRILSRLENNGLLTKVRSETDGRQRFLHLTPKGKEVFQIMNTRADNEVARMLDVLSDEKQEKLLKAMDTIEDILFENNKEKQPYILRQHEPGDMGWIIYRHGVLYAREYGWDEEFEALVAKICGEFITNYTPKRERCWIAEMDGEIIGSVLLSQSKQSHEIAELHVLLVEPKARGMGLGTRLVEECIKFARRTGYRKITLWTYSALESARRIYEKTGFQLIAEEKRHDFGQNLTGQTWEFNL